MSVSTIAPSRGGVLQLRGNPVHGALSETRVYFTALSLRTRTPGARALLPATRIVTDHPARWVRFSAPRPWM